MSGIVTKAAKRGAPIGYGRRENNKQEFAAYPCSSWAVCAFPLLTGIAGRQILLWCPFKPKRMPPQASVMKPAPFKYIAASSLDHALSLKAEYGDEARFLAGGQSLIPAMNFRLARPSVLIDINGLGG